MIWLILVYFLNIYLKLQFSGPAKCVVIIWLLLLVILEVFILARPQFVKVEKNSAWQILSTIHPGVTRYLKGVFVFIFIQNKMFYYIQPNYIGLFEELFENSQKYNSQKLSWKTPIAFFSPLLGGYLYTYMRIIQVKMAKSFCDLLRIYIDCKSVSWI